MGSKNSATFHRHVAVLDYPFTSHNIFTFALAQLLAACAPDVFFSFLGTAKSNASLASIPAPPNLTLYDVATGVPEDYVSKSFKEESMLFLQVAEESFKQGMERAVREGAGGTGVTCILTDCFTATFARRIAEEIGVPWVAVRSGSASSVSPYVYRDLILQTLDATQPNEDQEIYSIPCLPALTYRELDEILPLRYPNHIFGRVIHEMAKALPKAAAVVLNTFEALEPGVVADLKHKLNMMILTVGPLNLFAPTKTATSDPHKCLLWLDSHPTASVAYVSFGTVACPTKVELANLALGLEVSGVPFLWSLNDKFLLDLPEAFLDRTAGRGLVVPWAPQVDTLNHRSTGVFVTHCGWKSIFESITAGVPMICRPICFDQMTNAKFVVNLWKVGHRIGEEIMSKESVVDALRVVLTSEEGKKMREITLGFKALAADVVGLSGSSTKNLKTLVELVRK